MSRTQRRNTLFPSIHTRACIARRAKFAQVTAHNPPRSSHGDANEQDSYWVRGRAMHRTSPTLLLGGEALAAGNRESDWTSVGAVLALHSGSNYSVAFKAGYRWQSGDNGAYGGIEVGVAF